MASKKHKTLLSIKSYEEFQELIINEKSFFMLSKLDGLQYFFKGFGVCFNTNEKFAILQSKSKLIKLSAYKNYFNVDDFIFYGYNDF